MFEIADGVGAGGRAGFDAPAGPGLLELLCASSPQGLSTPELVRYVAAGERLAGLAGALTAAAVAELDRRLETPLDLDERMAEIVTDPDSDPVHEETVAELMALWRCSRRYALDRINFARTLAEELPEVHAAWAAGEIGYGHARAFAEALAGRPGGQVAR
ncbi:MAG: DUF222 domain-containing protein, partial [Mycobacteriales bacterium]